MKAALASHSENQPISGPEESDHAFEHSSTRLEQARKSAQTAAAHADYRAEAADAEQAPFYEP